MSSFNIRAINLNLLPALDALLAETSVSAAAARTGVSQSAMSHSLARLRELLDDPLLVSAGRQMVPTARAQALAGPLRAALEQLRGALAAGAPFDPATAERQLAIAAFDYFEMIAVPELVAFLGRRAPNMTLRIERLSPAVTRRLVAGELDMVLDMADAAMPPSLKRRVMFAETFAVIARRDHPALERRLDPERYAALDHLLVAFRKGSGEGVVDRALAARGLRRRISLRVPSFLSAPLVVSRSDLICTMPRTIALRARQLFGVKVVAPPIELPAIDVAAFWPAQLDGDPAHAWFRDQLFSGRMLPDSLRRRLRRPRR